MDSSEITSDDVKAANRLLYDAIATRYEEIDGRRSPELETWICSRLRKIRDQVPGGLLLDLGTGSGLVMRCGGDVFDSCIGIDLSPKILVANNPGRSCVAGDIDDLPFADNSFDVITCFAVLHHLFDFKALVAEVARVIRPGGAFYTDHDMDKGFSSVFSPFLRLYRKIKNTRTDYVNIHPRITDEIYDLSERHEDGINTPYLISLLDSAGFSVEVNYHWFGLSPFFNRLFKQKRYPRRLAPIVSLVAVKGQEQKATQKN